jgi:hypothetical protein
MRYLVLLLTLCACLAPGGELLDSPLVPQVRAALESTRTEVPRVVYGEAATLPDGSHAACYSDHIIIMATGREALDHFTAHELVHWYIDESPYAGLPHFIEEGLADWIGCDLTGTLRHRVAESIQIGTLTIDPRHLSVDAEGWGLLTVREREDLTRAGFDVVKRLGLAKLRELATRSESVVGYLRESGVLEGR